MFREITFCIKDIKDGQLPCKNPKILWITDGAQGIPCPDKKGCITIKIPDGVVGCVSGEVICEDCGKCPPKPFTICPCNTSADCDSCEKCVDGLCVKLCENLCKDGQCVDCRDDKDCKDGKVCIDGECRCPNGKNFVNDRKECVSCLENSHCDKCQVCINGECVGKTCEQTCDPTTGECIECINSGHCQSRTDGKNCCENKKCVCCEGYIFNLALNRCIPKPECTLDSDCPECQVCVNGKCQPRACPEGTICIKDKCVPTCDCSNPICDRNSACTRYNSTTCICVKCEGSCTDHSHCGDSCYCLNKQCVPNPCAKPCSTGADCGPNCGCLNGKCIPCDSASCDNSDCVKIDGCKCTGTKCSGDPCNGPCNNGSDCGYGCGCLNGRCVSCDKLSCDLCALALGCNCTNSICLPVPKCDGICVSASDCPLGCTCYNGKCVSCASFSCSECDAHPHCKCTNGKCGGDPDSKNCKQTTKLEKIDCSFRASQSLGDCCNCPEIELKVSLVEITNNGRSVLGIPALDYKFKLELLKNGVLIDPIEFPISGNLSSKAITNYNIGTTDYNDSEVVYITLTGSNVFYFTHTLPKFGVTNGTNVKSYTLQMFQNTNIQLLNDCTYKVQPDNTLYSKVFNALPKLGDYFSKTIRSSDCRAPRITWYRGTSKTNISEKIKEVYATKGALVTGGENVWYDSISSCKEGFCSGFWYKAIFDCGCNNETESKEALFCPKDLDGKYNFSKFKYLLSKCGKEFKITDMFDNCLINSKSNNCPKCPDSSHVKFILKLYTEDGLVKKEDFYFDLGSEIIGYTYTSTKPIIKVTLEHSQIPDCKVETSHNSGLDFTVEKDCKLKTIKGVVSNQVAACTVKLYDKTNLNIPIAITQTNPNGSYVFSNVVLNKTYIVKFECECVGEKEIYMNCCENGTNSNLIVSYDTVFGKLTVNVTNSSSTSTYLYSVDGQDVHTGTFSESFSISLSNGVHFISATDSNGCLIGPESFEVDSCPTTIITPIVTYDSTIGNEKVIVQTINGGTPAYTVQLINPSGSIVNTVNNVTSGPIEIFASAYPDGVYIVTVTDANLCTGSSFITLKKGQLCDNDPADINASRVYPGNNVDCNPATQTELYVNNGYAPYQVIVTKQGYGLQSQEGFVNLGNSSSGNITYTSTTGGQDKYNVKNLTDGIYVFKVTDSRGCTDEVSIKVECTCQSPINFNTAGIICDDLDTDHILVINSISGGLGSNYRVKLYLNDSCFSVPFIDTVLPTGNYTEIVIPGINTLPFGQSYSVKVISGICETNCILLAAPDCSGDPGPGGGGGNNGCPISPYMFSISGGCTTTVTNNSPVAVNFSWSEVLNSDCSGVSFNHIPHQTIAAGASATFPAFSYPGLYHKWTAVYTGGTGDPCSVSGCHTGCHTNQSCGTIPTPVLECVLDSSYRRLKITNTSLTDDFIVNIDGVDHSAPIRKSPGAGSTIYKNYPMADTGVKVVKFKCPYNGSFGPSASITMNC